MLRTPKISADRLSLSGDKVFFSVQGEGPSIGLPAIFLRLHCCNLNCSWCDTPYTWNQDLREFHEEWQQYSIEETCDMIRAFPCKHLVISGGEPLLQKEAIESLIRLMDGYTVEIESNATITVSDWLLKRCQFNLSPKLSNSGVAEEKRIKADVLSFFSVSENAYFKFVVDDNTDLEQVDKIVHLYQICRDRVIIMPQGQDRLTIEEKLKKLAEAVKTKGYRLLPRLHVQIWGNQRGV